MNVALWAEIRRLAEIDHLSGRVIARRLHCSRHTVAAALELPQPPAPQAARPLAGSVPGSDQGAVGQISRPVGRAHPRGDRPRTAGLHRRRLLFIEFTLSQRQAEFYRSLVNALTFFGGSPRQLIFDNLKAAVLNGSGRSACFHPDFLALCGYFCLQPVPCARRDPESKGVVEGGVRYVKHNALAGRADELTRFEDYLALAPYWRDQVANLRSHETTHERPLDRFQQERALLRPLPALSFDTDEVVPAVVSPHARIAFDGNRYSVPPRFVRRPITLRANREELRLLHEGQVVAQHVRSYERGQLLVLPEHRLAALTLRQRPCQQALEQAFDAWGPEARAFHLGLNSRPVKTSVHVRRLWGLAQLYGRTEVLAAISRALALATYDAASVENLLLAERRRQQLPTPTLPTPQRRELIDDIELEPADPARYDRFCHDTEEDSHGTT